MRARLAALALTAGIVWSSVPAAAVGLSGTFIDDDTSIHEAAIEAIAAEGVTRGCNPPTNDRFCPTSSVTRGQMAAFLHRAMVHLLTPGSAVEFIDDDTSEFESDIEWLAAVGVTRGCNPPTNDRFCPTRSVTRGEMAAFLVRALGLSDRGSTDFVDDDNSVFEADIERLAAAGITRGCNPPTNDRFCPNRAVTRAEMATFLGRGLGYDPIVPRLNLNSGWACTKDGLVCSGSTASRPGRTVEVIEGWSQALPFGPGEESQFRDSSTRFELRVDGVVQSLGMQPEASTPTYATRQWTTTVTTPPSGTMVIEGRWFWNGDQIKRTRITVSIS